MFIQDIVTGADSGRDGYAEGAGATCPRHVVAGCSIAGGVLACRVAGGGRPPSARCAAMLHRSNAERAAMERATT